jgi:DNA-binding IclR family transcriptional regulator
MLKSQAVGLLLKLVCIENAERKSEQVDVQQYGVRRLAEQTGISKSQVSLLLNHLLEIVAVAIKHDAALYDLLALVDCVRLGQARERQVAVAQLEQLLGKSV